MNTVRILAVDDHEMTALGYKYILEDSEFADFNVKVEIATNFDQGKSKIEMSKRAVPYDVILLDIQLFSPESKDPRTGIDLGMVARKEVPKSKVVFMSSYSDNYRINNIFKTVNPDGYMVKSIVNDSPYYTASALSAIRRRMSTDIVIDEQDQKILYHLSQGIHTRDIAPLIGSANTTVEARKRQLKALFDVKNGNDLALINEAKTRGFL